MRNDAWMYLHNVMHECVLLLILCLPLLCTICNEVCTFNVYLYHGTMFAHTPHSMHVQIPQRVHINSLSSTRKINERRKVNSHSRTEQIIANCVSDLTTWSTTATKDSLNKPSLEWLQRKSDSIICSSIYLRVVMISTSSIQIVDIRVTCEVNSSSVSTLAYGFHDHTVRLMNVFTTQIQKPRTTDFPIPADYGRWLFLCFFCISGKAF